MLRNGIRRGMTMVAATALLASLSPVAGEEGLSVGAPPVKGARIQAYEATWSQKVPAEDGWSDMGSITEKAWVEQKGGKQVLMRDSTYHHPQGLEFTTSVSLDHKTMAPLLWSRVMPDELPEQAKAQMTKEESLRFEGARYSKISRSFDGKATEDNDGKLSAAMFDGSTLGLVLASLPLRQDFKAKLPVLFINPQDTSLTEYWIAAHVVGSEDFLSAAGKKVKAWEVEVEWSDFESGEVSSKGGADQAGGAYWIVPDPPKGFPYVPRYANESVRIELMPGGKG